MLTQKIYDRLDWLYGERDSLKNRIYDIDDEIIELEAELKEKNVSDEA